MRLWSVIGGWQYWSAYMIKIHMIRNCGFTWLHVLFVLHEKKLDEFGSLERLLITCDVKFDGGGGKSFFSLAAATSAKYECIASGAYYRYCKCSPIVVNKQRLKHIWMWFGRFQIYICESRNFLNGEINEQNLDIPQLLGSLLLKWTGGGEATLHLNQAKGHLNWRMGLPALLGGNLDCWIV